MSSTIVAFGADPSFKYMFNPKGADPAPPRALMPTITDVRVSGVTPEKVLLALHPGALPFGLVESIALLPASSGSGSNGTDEALAPQPPYRFHVVKSTGSRESVRCTRWGRRQSLTYGTLRNDHDCTDEALAAVYRDTGHQMASRMVSGASIMSVCIELYGPPPPSFIVRFYGANTIPADRVDTPLVPPLPLGMPPITAEQRARLAGRAVQAGTATGGTTPTTAA